MNGASSTFDENVTIGGDANHNGILTIRSKDSSSVTRQSALKFNIAGTDTVGLTLHNNTSGIATNTLIFDWAGSDKIFFYGNGHITTVDNVTAKVFRDYDNTAYYVDPAGSTNINSLMAGEIVSTNHVYGRSVNNEYSLLYRFGGLFLTWDSDSYGTNFNHSITSTDNGTYSDLSLIHI